MVHVVVLIGADSTHRQHLAMRVSSSLRRYHEGEELNESNDNNKKQSARNEPLRNSIV